MTDIERDKRIEEEYAAGATLRALGRSYGLTSERVRQILTNKGSGTRPPGPRPDPSRVRRRPKSLHDRFFSHIVVQTDDEGTAHWVWRRLSENGYGTFRIGGALEYAHRAAFKIIKGRAPLRLKKTCSVRGCVNPVCWTEDHTPSNNS